jgi:hypothetical protein
MLERLNSDAIMHSGSLPQNPGTTVNEVIGYFPVIQMIGLLDLSHLAFPGPMFLAIQMA